MHISERMGELVGIAVKWQHDKMKLDGGEKHDIKAQIMKLKSTSKGLTVEHYGGVILCDRKVAVLLEMVINFSNSIEYAILDVESLISFNGKLRDSICLCQSGFIPGDNIFEILLHGII